MAYPQRDYQTLKSPVLQKLAATLPTTLLASRAENTTKTYEGELRRFKSWVSQFAELKYLPASPETVTLYLLSLIQGGKSSAVLLAANYAISWAHNLAGLSNPTAHITVKNVLEAGRRLNGKPVSKKSIITVDILAKIIAFCQDNADSLPAVRSATLCLLGFAGFLRYNELSNIRRCDVRFHSEYMTLFIEKSKTDIYRDGRSIVIAKTNTMLCPVTMLQKYLNIVSLSDDTCDDLIFRSLSYCKASGRHRLRQEQRPLSYSTVRTSIKNLLISVGEDPSRFGVHSLRSGGASAAANNGVTDRMFKRHGRWKSETAKDGYVKDSLESRLSVTLSLGL